MCLAISIYTTYENYIKKKHYIWYYYKEFNYICYRLFEKNSTTNNRLQMRLRIY